jgi:predicted permease
MTPNNGFIGIPVSLALFGQPILFLISLWNMMQAFFLYSAGAYFIRTRGGAGDSRPATGGATGATATGDGSPVATGDASLPQGLKDMLCPPVIACIAGAAFFLLRIPVPPAVMDVLDTVGVTMTPLCMMMIGIQLTQSTPKALFANKRLLALSLFRLIIIPALFFVLLLPLWNGSLPVKIDSVFLSAVMINFMTPVGAAVPPLAEMYGGNTKLASEAVFLSTLISLATIPVAGIFLTSL